jgi:hypothetical protein
LLFRALGSGPSYLSSPRAPVGSAGARFSSGHGILHRANMGSATRNGKSVNVKNEISTLVRNMTGQSLTGVLISMLPKDGDNHGPCP